MPFHDITSVSIIIVGLIFYFPLIHTTSTNQPDLSKWDNIFNDRGEEEWKEKWHTEKHRRCYQDIEDHMNWVCDKDIYKVDKKYDMDHLRDIRSTGNAVDEKPLDVFISKTSALNLFRSPTRQKRGIIEECCNAITGCSWEEYAEYCTNHNRFRA